MSQCIPSTTIIKNKNKFKKGITISKLKDYNYSNSVHISFSKKPSWIALCLDTKSNNQQQLSSMTPCQALC
jgi:hypothetical protein